VYIALLIFIVSFANALSAKTSLVVCTQKQLNAKTKIAAQTFVSFPNHSGVDVMITIFCDFRQF
jgi:hypothetical protein